MNEFGIYKKTASILNTCHVIQVRTLTGKKICSCIYDNETLFDLYEKCHLALFDGAPSTLNPDKPYHIIHDIVLADKKENIIFVPCDPNILFCEFKRANERYFVASKKIPVLSVYKIYVVDNEAVDEYNRKRNQQQQQQNIPSTIVSKIKRFMNCAF